MADAPSFSPRLHFARDLRAIREARALTLESLHDETKIPLGVLQDFEETGLSENPMFNRVYLRSLVRTYAIFIGIPSKVALEALDEALLDQYQGYLVNEFLAAVPPKPRPKATSVDAATDEKGPEESEDIADKAEGVPASEAEAVASEAATVKVPKDATVAEDGTPEAVEPGAPTPPTKQRKEERIDVSGAEEQPEKAVPPAEKTSPEKTSKEAGAKEQPALREYVGGTTLDKAVPPLLTTAEASWKARRDTGGSRRRQPVDVKKRASYTQWLFIIGTIVLLAVAIWAVLAFLDRPSETVQVTEPEPTVVADTTAAVPEAEPARPPILVGDTLDVVIIAVTKVERLHIKRDEDARRPYWIEEGVAKAYPVLERIVLEDRLDRIRLLVEGYEYPTDRFDEQGRIVITRDAVQAFVDTLTAAPVRLATAPDTIPLILRRLQ